MRHSSHRGRAWSSAPVVEDYARCLLFSITCVRWTFLGTSMSTLQPKRSRAARVRGSFQSSRVVEQKRNDCGFTDPREILRWSRTELSRNPPGVATTELALENYTFYARRLGFLKRRQEYTRFFGPLHASPRLHRPNLAWKSTDIETTASRHIIPRINM